MHKRNFLIILSIFIIVLGLNGSFANENTSINETVTVVENQNEEVYETNISNETYKGFCMDREAYSPTQPTLYNVSDDTSSVDQKIKNILIKYFRYNNTARMNFNIQCAIWKIVHNIAGYRTGSTQTDRDYVDMIMADQIGVVGNSYIDEEGNTFTFTFKYLTTKVKILSQPLQDILMFKYDFKEKPDESNNETPDIPTNNTTKIPPEKPKNETPFEPPETPVNEPPIVPPEDIPDEPVVDIPNIVVAGMKSTGMPIIAGLLILLAGLGITLRKKQ